MNTENTENPRNRTPGENDAYYEELASRAERGELTPIPGSGKHYKPNDFLTNPQYPARELFKEYIEAAGGPEEFHKILDQGNIIAFMESVDKKHDRT